MSYYICPLHTLWTLFIYAGLGIARKMNDTTVGIFIKIFLLLGIVVFIWDVPGVWEAVFGPFFLVSFLQESFEAR